MPAGSASLPLAIIAVPTAAQFLWMAAPFAALVALRWFLGRLDHLIHRLFPTLEWERQLGWLNIRAERRAARVLRWLGYAVYALLAAALYGMAWGAVGFRAAPLWDGPDAMASVLGRLPVFFACLGLLVFYLAGSLLPRLRREYEQEELERFRAEFISTEDQEGRIESRLAQVKSPFPAPPATRSRR
jgi:hypothetical protein